MSSVAALFGVVGISAIAARSILRASRHYGLKPPQFDMSHFRDLRGFEQTMSRSEACKILGIGRTTLNKETIKTAQRNLLSANHPDKGGSTFLATKINEAKDVLLGKSAN